MRRLMIFVLVAVLAGCGGSNTRLTFAPASAAPPTESSGAASATPAPPSDRPSAAATTSPATPEPSGAWVRHTSERFGYSLELPPGWRNYQKATEDWPPNVYPTALSPFTDKYDRPPDPFPGIDISTQRLADGQTREAFLTWLDGENAKICTINETDEIVVDGATGRLQRQTCGYNAWEMAVVDDRQVYIVYWLGSSAPIDEERATFQRIMSTFRFAP